MVRSRHASSRGQAYWRNSLLSNCSLWDETTLPRKYTWQKGRATCRYWIPACVVSASLLQLLLKPLLACLVLSPMLCYQAKIGDLHQNWMLPHFLGGLCDYYSLSDIKSIYCIATEDLLIIHLLYKYERAFHLESVVVASCWSVENLGWKISIEARLPRVPLLFSKIVCEVCSSSAHWRLQINLSSPVLFVKEIRVQSLVMLRNLRSQ